MKNLSDGTAATPAPEPQKSETEIGQKQEQDGFVSRKSIRPTLQRENVRGAIASEMRSAEARNLSRTAKQNLPEQTFAEVFYFQKQIQSRTSVAVVLQNGETVEGILEWYDRESIRLTRRDHSNLLIYKPGIKYIYKKAEER